MFAATTFERIFTMPDVYTEKGSLGEWIEIESADLCSHKNAVMTGKMCSSGCCSEFRCRDCGKAFLVEGAD